MKDTNNFTFQKKSSNVFKKVPNMPFSYISPCWYVLFPKPKTQISNTPVTHLIYNNFLHYNIKTTITLHFCAYWVIKRGSNSWLMLLRLFMYIRLWYGILYHKWLLSRSPPMDWMIATIYQFKLDFFGVIEVWFWYYTYIHTRYLTFIWNF